MEQPQWIPIKSKEDVAEISEGGYVTLERKDGTRFVVEVHPIKTIHKSQSNYYKPIAYMIIKYPDPYDK